MYLFICWNFSLFCSYNLTICFQQQLASKSFSFSRQSQKMRKLSRNKGSSLQNSMVLNLGLHLNVLTAWALARSVLLTSTPSSKRTWLTTSTKVNAFTCSIILTKMGTVSLTLQSKYHKLLLTNKFSFLILVLPNNDPALRAKVS